MSTTFHFRILPDAATPRKKQVFEGQRKTLFEGQEPGTYICHFTDVIKKGTPLISGKGVINNRISELFFSKLAEINVASHFIKRLNMREQVIRSVDPLPFKIRVYNIANKCLQDRFLIEKGTQLPRPLFEFLTKGSLPHVMSREHVVTFGWSNELELDDMLTLAQRINDFLYGYFNALGFRLVSINLEFGRLYGGEFMENSELLLIDEISPDTFDLQDASAKEFLVIDLHETDLATVAATYQHIAERLKVLQTVNNGQQLSG